MSLVAHGVWDTNRVATDDSGTWNDHAKMKICTDCDGEGVRKSKVSDAQGNTVEVKGTCNTCRGTGRVKDSA